MNPSQLDKKVSSHGGVLLRSDFDSNDELIAALVVYPAELVLYTRLGINMFNWDAIDNIRAKFPKQEPRTPISLSDLDMYSYDKRKNRQRNKPS